ncbi:1144_t:CDS:2 [Diversispora eburnea]|uniref:1144_t:CDS:1 n=1 Tax=Diversispora eburnea TaxID=1213867 RepID=A0A9N9GLM8_9GLOM|nr:1144_t:CDS:2 [Diversispora eburnea]
MPSILIGGTLTVLVYSEPVSVEAMQNELERAVKTGHFLSEYNNGLVVFKPNSVWRVVKNRSTGRRYMRAVGAELRAIGRRIECFDERVTSEKQAYINFLIREAKGITDVWADH